MDNFNNNFNNNGNQNNTGYPQNFNNNGFHNVNGYNNYPQQNNWNNPQPNNYNLNNQNGSYPNYNYPTTPINNYNNGKNPKKRGGCLMALLKFFLFLVLIIAIIIGGVVYFGHKKEQEEIKKIEESLVVEDIIEDVNKELEVLKTRNSDIVGMTEFDKLDMGLNPSEGSDTDGDGLTDKEEIEVYGSDPLLASTAGDGIPDGFKVANQLKFNQKYDIVEVGYNSFSNISIKNLDTSVISISEIEGYSMNGVPTEMVYSISNYNGKLEFDFSDYITENIEYLIFKKNDESNSEYEVLKDKNGVVSVETNGKDCVVGLVNIGSSTTINGLFDTFNSNEPEVIEGNDAIFVCFPITGLTGELKVFVFEKSLFNTDKTKSAYLTEYFNNIFTDEDDVVKFKVEHRYVNVVEYNTLSKVLNYIYSGTAIKDMLKNSDVSTTEEDISTFRAILTLFFMVLEIDETGWVELNNLEIETPEEENKKAEKVSEYVSGFDVTKDALPFPNFGSYISPGGNCAGFSLITTQLFNDSLYASTAKSTFDEESYSYDISNKDYYSTFFDIHLNDYKDYSYWKNTYPNMAELSRNDFKDEDRNFLDFIGYKWAEGNDVDKGIIWFNNELPWSDFEKVIDYFKNNNKILNLSMSSGGSGHAINAYGVEQDKDNPNIWYILVYDNNFPNNEYDGKPVNNRVKIVRKNPLLGEDYFEFDYYPLPNKAPNYRYTSYATIASHAIITATQAHMFVLTDEYLNTLIGGEK